MPSYIQEEIVQVVAGETLLPTESRNFRRLELHAPPVLQTQAHVP